MAYGLCASIYLVSVSLCIRVLVYLAWNDRRRSSQHPIEIHSMDHRASLTSLSHFLPITYITFPRKVQPFFSQFEYIVPSADIHMYIRPIFFPLSPFPPVLFLSLSLSHVEAFLPGPSVYLPSLSLSLAHSPRFLLHTYRSFYLANPTGGFVVA